MVTASEDHTARLWRVFSSQDLIDYAKNQVPRQLTLGQRKQFYLPLDPQMTRAQTLEEIGTEWVAKGQVKAALDKFTQALILDGRLRGQAKSETEVKLLAQAKVMWLATQQAQQWA